MSRFLEEGQKFNRLTVMNYHGRNKHGRSLYKFKCECGREVIALGSSVKTGVRKSCGCLKIEKAIERFKKHDKVYTKEYIAWNNMKKNKKGQICDDWMTFEKFYEDIGEAPSKEHHLRLINKDGIYEKGNVDWFKGTNNKAILKNPSKSGKHKGISFKNANNKYQAYFNDGKKQIYVGLFETIEKAIDERKKAVDDYNKKYGKEIN